MRLAWIWVLTVTLQGGPGQIIWRGPQQEQCLARMYQWVQITGQWSARQTPHLTFLSVCAEKDPRTLPPPDAIERL